LKAAFLNILKVLIPVSIAMYIVYVVYNTLSVQEKETLFEAFTSANYFWVLLSVSCGILSHLSRAYRWKYLQEPLGYSFNFANAFMAVMIGYFANLALPRIGEIARCGIIAKAEGKDINKLIGTVVAERVSDVLMLLVAIIAVLFFEYSVLAELFEQIYSTLFGAANKFMILGSLFIGFVFVSYAIYVLLKRYFTSFLEKISSFLGRILSGVQTFTTMKHKKAFALHTVFIWFMYVMMIYLCIFSLPSLSHLTFTSIVACFVMGSISIVFVQGGIGAYPLAIMQTLVFYDIAKPLGLALGWIVWSAQTAMIIVVGLLSFILISWVVKRNTSTQAA